MSHSQDTGPEEYYIQHEGSYWPAIAIAGMLGTTAGASMMMNESSIGLPIMYVGLAIVAFMFFGWFRQVVKESRSGLYNAQMDRSFRQGMSWFIFSEVMFFAAFFGALYYARAISGPWLGGAGNNLATNLFLWTGFESAWPTNGPANWGGDYEVMGPTGLPLYNTLLLLTSGVTLTWAHWGLFKNNNRQVVLGLAATVALGSIFLFFQAEEYIHAYSAMNLTLESGVYGSTFYLLTGFHGMHVTLGTIMLLVITIRSMRKHFDAENHFAFEAVAWYWHFVDVVWLGLFIFVYIL